MLLEVEGLTKIYQKKVRANDNISLSVDSGEVLGLLGHNGAGKTTLLNQVIGLAKPTSGTIRLDGRDPVAHPALARRLCSFQQQGQAPLEGVSPSQAIEMIARIRGANRRRARTRTGELIDALDLGPWANKTGERLSGGVRRLTAFCMAAVEPGRLVMLDEPTNDVDPVRRRLLWDQVRALGAQGCAVVLVTHNVIEGERAVQRLVILDEGKVVVQGDPTQLRADSADRLRLELVAADEEVAQQLAGQVAGVEAPVISGRRVTVPIEVSATATTLAWAQQEREAGRVDEFAVTPVSLEDIYIKLVDKSERGTPQEVDRASLDS